MNYTQKIKKSQSITKNKVVVVLGPTASGKTKLAVRLAKKFDGEIISADSRQVYRGMDIGSGKDLKEYGIIKYHLIDVVSPKVDYNVAKWQMQALQAIKDILKKDKLPILCGGTGLYLKSIIDGYVLPLEKNNHQKREELNKLSLNQLLGRLKKVDAVTYSIIDKHNRRRVQRALEIYFQTGKPKSVIVGKQTSPFIFLEIGLNFPREELRKRINRRLRERLKNDDLINEVRKLKKIGVSQKRLENFGLEYRYVSRYLAGQMTRDEMVSKLETEINRFAKRQLTWFRRDKNIIWENNYRRLIKLIDSFLNQ